MKIVISGAGGMIGRAVASALAAANHEVWSLSRSAVPGNRTIRWSPPVQAPDLSPAGRMDAVIHLAGESIASLWTKSRREAIRSSRVEGTRLLAGALLRMDALPGCFLSASAVGYYGDRGGELLREDSGPGRGFLPEVCREWEKASEPMAAAGVRTVQLRFGIVLSRSGGMLPRMVRPFRLGLGGRLGSGRQYFSWIALEDAVGAILHALGTPALAGPVNATSPNPVTNAEFTAALAAVLKRPARLGVPPWVLRLAPGGMGDELLLASARVLPERLLAGGFRFRYPELPAALQNALER